MEGVIQQTRNFITFLQDVEQMEVSWRVKLWGNQHSPGYAQRGPHCDDPVRWLTVLVEPQERLMLREGRHMGVEMRREAAKR